MLRKTGLAGRSWAPGTGERSEAIGMLLRRLSANAPQCSETVLVCWRHGKLPELAQALGVTPPQDPWPGSVFDRYWVIDSDVHG